MSLLMFFSKSQFIFICSLCIPLLEITPKSRAFGYVFLRLFSFSLSLLELSLLLLFLSLAFPPPSGNVFLPLCQSII